MVTKVDAIDTSKLVFKIQYNSDKESFEKDIENKISGVSGLVTAAARNLKATENKKEIRDAIDEVRKQNLRQKCVELVTGKPQIIPNK